MPADDRMRVAVVIERRELDNPWQDHAWLPVDVLPRASAGDGWRRLAEGPGWTRFLSPPVLLALHRDETEGYRSNLSQEPPSVFVVLRSGEEARENEVELFLVTVCPYEAMGYVESGDEIVEGVAMPAELIAWVQTFVDRHHVDEPFKKRKNKRHRLDDRGSRPRGRFSRELP